VIFSFLEAKASNETSDYSSLPSVVEAIMRQLQDKRNC